MLHIFCLTQRKRRFKRPSHGFTFYSKAYWRVWWGQQKHFAIWRIGRFCVCQLPFSFSNVQRYTRFTELVYWSHSYLRYIFPHFLLQGYFPKRLCKVGPLVAIGLCGLNLQSKPNGLPESLIAH